MKFGIISLILCLLVSFFLLKNINIKKNDIKKELVALHKQDTYPLNFTKNIQGVFYYKEELKKSKNIKNYVRNSLELSIQYILSGMYDDAISQLYELENKCSNFLNKKEKYYLNFNLGLAHQRKAEDINCRVNYENNSCIFPFREEVNFIDIENLSIAIKYYKESLNYTKEAEDINRNLWLINICEDIIAKKIKQNQKVILT
jgi:hypothetical protein